MDEAQRLRRMRFAWILFFVGPLLMAQGLYCGIVAGIEDSKGSPDIFWRLISVASWVGGLAGLITFLALSFKYGRRVGR